MPTVLRWNGYRFHFYSHENSEPPHIHVDKGNGSAKFWLNPVKLASSSGFEDNTLSDLHKKVVAEQQAFLRAWHEFFGQ